MLSTFKSPDHQLLSANIGRNSSDLAHLAFGVTSSVSFVILFGGLLPLSFVSFVIPGASLDEDAANVLRKFLIPIYLSMLLLSCWSVRYFHRALPVLLTFAPFATVALSSWFWSIDPNVTLRRAAVLWLVMIYCIALGTRFNIDQVCRFLMTGFVISNALNAAFLVVFPHISFDAAGNFRGIYTHKTVLGTHVGIGLIVTVWQILHSFRPKAVVVANLVFGLLFLVLSHSIGAVVIFISSIWAASIAGNLARGGYACVLLLMSGFLLIGLAAGLWILDPKIILALVGKDVTLTGRTVLWELVTPFILERPVLGYGYRAFWESQAGSLLSDLLRYKVHHAHNSWLDVRLQIGHLGLGSVCWLLMATAIFLYKAIRRRQSHYAFFLGALLSYLVLTMMLESPLEMPRLVLFAFIVAVALRTSGPPKPLHQRRKTWRYGVS